MQDRSNLETKSIVNSIIANQQCLIKTFIDEDSICMWLHIPLEIYKKNRATKPHWHYVAAEFPNLHVIYIEIKAKHHTLTIKNY